MNTYDYGDTARFRATIRNASGVLADASSVVIKVKDPAGNVTTPAVVHDGTGLYHCDQVVNQEGTWFYRFEATSPTSTGEDRVFVRNSAFY